LKSNYIIDLLNRHTCLYCLNNKLSKNILIIKKMNMNKMDRNIMVIKTSVLFGNEPRKNWFYTSEFNFEKNILKNFEYMKRWLAEENINYKQPLPYAILKTNDWRLFMYQRWWKTSEVWEKRLYDKISFGVWWHIEEDVKNASNPLLETLLREIEEEVWISSKNIDKIDLIWYINDDTNDVGKVHFWIAYIVTLNTDDVKIDKWELANWKFITEEEAKNILNDKNINIESWSRIIMNVILDLD